MGFFDRTTEPQATPPGHLPHTPSSSLSSISYGIAYYDLPQRVFREREALVEMFCQKPEAVGPFFYLLGCKATEFTPVKEYAELFLARVGQLDESRDYYLLEFPEPPPMDLTGVDLERLPPGAMPVLAPYYSAMVIHRSTGAVQYFVLGQAPLGGTTLRSVTANGRNSNLGRGPEPSIEAFLEAVRAKV